MELHSIYKITHTPSGLFYIGRTKQDPKLRFAEHIIAALTSSDKRKSKIHELIAREDINDFRLDVLESDIPGSVEAIKRERYYIQNYRACENGLNTYASGSGYRTIDDSIKKAVAISYMNGYSIAQICRHYSISAPSAIKYIKEEYDLNHVFYRGLIPAPYYIDPNQII